MSSIMSHRLEDVLHFDIKITDKNLDTSIQTLVSHLKKSWNVNKLIRKVFDSGITNKLYGIYVNHDGATVSPQFTEYGRSEMILVRIYGNKTDLVIDRAQELRNFQQLATNDLAPAIYCTFSNGYCYRYIEGRILGSEDLKNEVILKLCAKQLAKMHNMQLSESYLRHHQMESTVFKVVQRYIGLIPPSDEVEQKHQKSLERIPSVQELQHELQQLEAVVSKFDMQVVFCHNDLLCANFIYDEYNEKMSFIDYEYGAPNYSAYDVANHFNEFAGVETVDYSLYPSKETQFLWIKTYLKKRNALKDIDCKVEKEEVEIFYSQVQVFSLLSHLFWGVWAIIQAHNSDIDFDYMEYSALRLGEYFKRKEEFLTIGKLAQTQ